MDSRDLLRAARESRASLENGDVPLTSNLLLDIFGAVKGSAGIRVTKENVMGLTAVFRAVALLSGLVASADKGVFDDNGQPLPDDLLDDPSPVWSDFEFWELAMNHLLLDGNAYIYKVGARRLSNRPASLHIIHPDKVTPQWLPNAELGGQEKIFKVVLASGEAVVMDSIDIMHIMGPSSDGLVGLSPIAKARETLGASLAQDKYAAKFFGSGSLLSGLLKTDKRLKEEEANTLKRRWQQKVAGLDNAAEIAVLDNGADYMQLSVNPKDAQFIEGREFGVREVARLFGVPPHMLMADINSSNYGSGVEQQNIAFELSGFRTWTKRLQSRVKKEFNVTFKIDSAFITRGDMRSRFSSYVLARKANLGSVNELRALEGWAPLDDPRADDPFEPIATGGEEEADGAVGGTSDGGDTTTTDPSV